MMLNINFGKTFHHYFLSLPYIIPFKDINWAKVQRKEKMSFEIARQNAIICAKADKNIQKVEFLT